MKNTAVLVVIPLFWRIDSNLRLERGHGSVLGCRRDGDSARIGIRMARDVESLLAGESK